VGLAQHARVNVLLGVKQCFRAMLVTYLIRLCQDILSHCKESWEQEWSGHTARNPGSKSGVRWTHCKESWEQDWSTVEVKAKWKSPMEMKCQ